MLPASTVLTIFQPLFKVCANPPDVNVLSERDAWSQTMQCLAALPEPHLRQVVQYMLRHRTSPFFPRLPEINEASQAVHRATYPSVDESWVRVGKFIQSHPHGTEHTFDPITHRAIELMGGMWRIRQSYNAKPQFVKAYQQALTESYQALYEL